MGRISSRFLVQCFLYGVIGLKHRLNEQKEKKEQKGQDERRAKCYYVPPRIEVYTSVLNALLAGSWFVGGHDPAIGGNGDLDGGGDHQPGIGGNGDFEAKVIILGQEFSFLGQEFSFADPWE